MSQSDIYKRVEERLLAATKNREVFVVKVLRFLKSRIDAEAKAKLSDLSDAEVVKIIQKSIKQSQDAKGQFEQGNRADLVKSEQDEIDLLKNYLPQQLSQEEIIQAARRIIAESGQDAGFGPVMKRVMQEVSGKADGKQVKEVVETLLKTK